MSRELDAREVVDFAKRSRLTFAVAESLTGGMVCDALVSIAGASEVFIGGVVSYHTDLKHSLLGVSDQLLHDHGPVDAAVAEEMARGVRVACATQSSESGARQQPDIGLAITGVAGPDPDPASGQRPGTVWVAVSSVRGERSQLFDFAGDRPSVREQASAAALALLLDELRFSTAA